MSLEVVRQKEEVCRRMIMRRATGKPGDSGYDGDLIRAGWDMSEALEQLTDDDVGVYIQQFQNATGFPKLEQVSQRIMTHALDALEKSASEVGNIKIKYSGYDRSCSVGRSLSLPGSDLDGWNVVYEGPKEAAIPLRNRVVCRLDPNLMDVYSLPVSSVHTLDELKLCMEKPLYEVFKSPAFHIVTVLETIRNDGTLINNLGSLERDIKASRLYNESYGVLGDPDLVLPEKQKHIKRAVLGNFDRFTPEQQYLVVRAIQRENEGVPVDLSLSDRNPHYRAIYELVENKVLEPLKGSTRTYPLWIHSSKNAQTIYGVD